MSGDKDLLERITREVMRRLDEGSIRSGGGRLSAAGSTVVVVTECPVGIDEAVRRVETLSRPLILLVAGCCKGGAGEEFASRIRADVVVREGDPCDMNAILGETTLVAVPLLSMTAAAKISLGIADSLASSAVLSALSRRIPVVAAVNGISGGENRTPGMENLGKDYVSSLASLGIRTVDIREFPGGSGVAPEAANIAGSGPDRASGTGGVEETVRCVTNRLASKEGAGPFQTRLAEAIQNCVDAGACRIGATLPADPGMHAASGLAGMIDHTLLKPGATPEDIADLCAEAANYGFASVCINPQYVSLAAKLLKGSNVKVCTVIGFPLGATTTTTKVIETRDAVADGADEIDMVINIGALKGGEHDKVRHDIEEVVNAASGRIVKVILETALLTDEEKVAGCEIAKAAGADFVKTSTGFGGGGATAEDIRLMRKVVGPVMGVKASGGVRTRADAEKMVMAGATRIGASASVAIVTGEKRADKGY